MQRPRWNVCEVPIATGCIAAKTTLFERSAMSFFYEIKGSDFPSREGLFAAGNSGKSAQRRFL
jgi:hypothetical protein